jgi:hypothetical protein
MSRLLMVAVSFAVACGPPPPPDPDGGVDLDAGQGKRFEVGTTTADGTGYLAMTPDLEAHPGAQGGFHLNVMYLLPEGGAGPVTFEHEVRLATNNTLVSRGSRVFDLGLFRVSTWTSPTPVTVFMCPTPIGVNVIGAPLNFSVVAKDANGLVLGRGTASTTFRCSTSSSMYCESTCKG